MSDNPQTWGELFDQCALVSRSMATTNVPPNILYPSTVVRLVLGLTAEETDALAKYAALAQDSEDYIIRTSSWLIRKFPEAHRV
jgi:hypothetical protein